MRWKKAFGGCLGSLFPVLRIKGCSVVVSTNTKFTVCFSQYATAMRSSEHDVKLGPRIHCWCAVESGPSRLTGALRRWYRDGEHRAPFPQRYRQ